MEFHEAVASKWESGRRKYRKGPGDSFIGDPAEELYQELLDAYSYVEVLEGYGVQLAGWKTTLKNMALSLQDRRRELKWRL